MRRGNEKKKNYHGVSSRISVWNQQQRSKERKSREAKTIKGYAGVCCVVLFTRVAPRARGPGDVILTCLAHTRAHGQGQPASLSASVREGQARSKGGEDRLTLGRWVDTTQATHAPVTLLHHHQHKPLLHGMRSDYPLLHYSAGEAFISKQYTKLNIAFR